MSGAKIGQQNSQLGIWCKNGLGQICLAKNGTVQNWVWRKYGLHKNGHTNMDGAKMSADHFKIRLLNTDIEKNRKGELEYIQEMNR